MLKDKKVLLCVTGGIAVYKAAALTSKLTQAGAQCKSDYECICLSICNASYISSLVTS